MALTIIVKKGKSNSWKNQKDILHRRRKQLAGELKEGIFSKDQMMQRDCKTEADEKKRVADYDKWKKKNEPKMREWSDINKKFKENKEEGKPQSIDAIRENKVKYD